MTSQTEVSASRRAAALGRPRIERLRPSRPGGTFPFAESSLHCQGESRRNEDLPPARRAPVRQSASQPSMGLPRHGYARAASIWTAGVIVTIVAVQLRSTLAHASNTSCEQFNGHEMPGAMAVPRLFASPARLVRRQPNPERALHTQLRWGA